MKYKKLKTALIHAVILFIGLTLGWQLKDWDYTDKCLDIGGGRNPGNYDICVVDKG